MPKLGSDPTDSKALPNAQPLVQIPPFKSPPVVAPRTYLNSRKTFNDVKTLYSKIFESYPRLDMIRRLFEEELILLENAAFLSSDFLNRCERIEQLLRMPTLATTDTLDVPTASKTLNNDLFGLDESKDLILQYFAGSNAMQFFDTAGKIICFCGNSGVGKTLLAETIGKCLNRKVASITLYSGIDCTDLVGCSTDPGRIVLALQTAGSINPVIILENISSRQISGPVASVLRKVLDYSINSKFYSVYFNAHVDLSKVIFIGTMEMGCGIDWALHDLFDFHIMDGYDLYEQKGIAKDYLLPMLARETGQNKGIVSDECLEILIRNYTRDNGVGRLEGLLRKLFRQVKVDDSVGTGSKKRPITKDNLHEYVGVSEYKEYDSSVPLRIGEAVGLSGAGCGEISVFESSQSPLMATGIDINADAGDVLKRSAKTGYVYAQQYLSKVLPKNKNSELRHVQMNIINGQNRKDGDSAGITIATSLISLALLTPLQNGLAMTGVLTETGRVERVGEIRKKLNAAKSFGFKCVIVPEGNRKKIDSLPPAAKDGLKLIYAKTFDDVFKIAFPKFNTNL